MTRKNSYLVLEAVVDIQLVEVVEVVGMVERCILVVVGTMLPMPPVEWNMVY